MNQLITETIIKPRKKQKRNSTKLFWQKVTSFPYQPARYILIGAGSKYVVWRLRSRLSLFSIAPIKSLKINSSPSLNVLMQHVLYRPFLDTDNIVHDSMQGVSHSLGKPPVGGGYSKYLSRTTCLDAIAIWAVDLCITRSIYEHLHIGKRILFGYSDASPLLYVSIYIIDNNITFIY